MAIKDMIGRGIGFNPGKVGFIVTVGLDSLPASNLLRRSPTIIGDEPDAEIIGKKPDPKIIGEF